MFSLRSNSIASRTSRLAKGADFLSDAIYEACAAKATMYSLRSYFFKSKSIDTSLVDTR